jgi:hypothetical protein
MLHRAFEHERRAGHGVQHVAVLVCGGDELVGDRTVDDIERVSAFVHRVERLPICNSDAGRMTRGTQVPVPASVDLVSNLLRDVLGPGRADADHRHTGRSDPCHQPPFAAA